MIVAIASLITALFLGGPAEIFYVDNLEKGIKKQVLEKERKKEILSEIKSTKTLYKDFEKERKKDYKSFLNLYMDKNTTPDGLNSFFKELKEKRVEYQNKLIDQRLVIYEKIQSEEWDNILESSVSVSEKNLAKAEKTGTKAKEDFRKTKSKIEEVIPNEAKKLALRSGLEVVINSGNELGKKIASQNNAHQIFYTVAFE